MEKDFGIRFSVELLQCVSELHSALAVEPNRTCDCLALYSIDVHIFIRVLDACLVTGSLRADSCRQALLQLLAGASKETLRMDSGSPNSKGLHAHNARNVSCGVSVIVLPPGVGSHAWTAGMNMAAGS